MVTSFRLGLCTGLALALAYLMPTAAFAAPPPNDQRSSAQAIGLPASVAGTTTDSTLEPDEPPGCAPLRGSVYYELQATAPRSHRRPPQRSRRPRRDGRRLPAHPLPARALGVRNHGSPRRGRARVPIGSGRRIRHSRRPARELPGGQLPAGRLHAGAPATWSGRAAARARRRRHTRLAPGHTGRLVAPYACGHDVSTQPHRAHVHVVADLRARHAGLRERVAGAELRLRRIRALHSRGRRERALQPAGHGPASTPGRTAVSPAGGPCRC